MSDRDDHDLACGETDDSRDTCERSNAPCLGDVIFGGWEQDRVIARGRRLQFREDVAGAGETIGRYRVLKLIGRGSWGRVYLCRDEKLDRDVALKRLVDRSGGGELSLREARALAAVQHENVVRILTIEEDEHGPFMTMEHIAGTNFDDGRRAQLPMTTRLERLLAAGRGLAAIHAANLVHHDFKPGNVRVGHDGEIKIVDFGLATERMRSLETMPDPSDSRDTHQTGPTHPGHGTVAYMAPELLRGEQASVASDVYAFCVVAYETLWGGRPFVCDDPLARSEAETHELITPKDHRRLFELIRVGLSFAPNDRMASMTELLAELLAELDRMQRRPTRRRHAVVLAACLAMTAAAVSWALRHERPAPFCKEIDVIDTSKRATLSETLDRLEPTSSHGKDSRALIEAGLADWTERWLEQRALLCKLGQPTPTGQSFDRLERRERCLDEMTERVEAFVDQLIEGKATSLVEAVVVMDTLPDPRGCMVSGVLPGLDTPPQGIRWAVAGLRRSLERVRMERAAGHWQEARTRALRIDKLATKLGHQPIEVEARAELAMIEDAAGRLDDAAKLYHEALAMAESSGQDHLAFEISIESAELAMKHHRLEAADELLRRAEAKQDRLDLDRDSRARLAFARGRLAQLGGDLDGAERSLREAVELTGERTSALPEYLDALAFVVADPDESLALRERALALARERFGPRHPSTAKRLYNYGAALQDKHGGGARERQLAAEIWAEQGGQASYWQLRVVQDLATRALRYGDLDSAERHARSMFELLERFYAADAHEYGEAELLFAQIQAMRADRSPPSQVRLLRRDASQHARRALLHFSHTPASTVRDPRVVSARLLLGNQQMELGELDGAAQELERALAVPDIDPTNEHIAHLRLAELALRRDDLDRADVELAHVDHQRESLGDERFSYDVLRSVVDHRLERPNDHQRAARLRRRDTPIPDSTLDRWLEQLGVDALERAELQL